MTVVPYRILVVDDQAGKAGLANLTRLAFHGDANFEVKGTATPEEGLSQVDKHLFDIFVLDIQLQQGDHTGIWLAEQLRNRGCVQPIILVTGAKTAKKWPIQKYESVLRRGPTYFYDRNPELPALEGEPAPDLLADIIRQAAGQTDMLTRALLVVKAAGIPQSPLLIDGQEISADELLGLASAEMEGHGSSDVVDRARIALRDSLQAMLARGLEARKQGKSKAKA